MLTKIVNSKKCKIFTVALAAMMLFSSFTMPAGQTVVLKAGTPIDLELVSAVSSDMNPGEIVDFTVTSDVKADGVVVIPAGSMAKGQIMTATKNGLLGKAGEVTVQVKSVTAADGTKVMLSGASLSDKGADKLAVSIIFTILCIFGFLIHGGNGTIPAGTHFDAMVASNVEIAI
jgi:hypothetical protein